jgi:TnpA family transposase
VLDGILDNETELPITENTFDTALVFSLFDLLGLQFSPRLRDLENQKLYRIDAIIRYQNIGRLVRGTLKTRLMLDDWNWQAKRGARIRFRTIAKRRSRMYP